MTPEAARQAGMMAMIALGAILMWVSDREFKRLAQAGTPPVIEPRPTIQTPEPTRTPAKPAQRVAQRDPTSTEVDTPLHEAIRNPPAEAPARVPARTRMPPPAEAPVSKSVVLEASLPPAMSDFSSVLLGRCIPVESDAELALLYFTLVGKEPEVADWEWLAGRFSSDYRMTQDAFKKQEMLVVLKAKFESQMHQFKNRCFIVTNTVYLGHYDMAKGSFPLHPQGPVPQLWTAEAPWTYLHGTQRVQLSVSNMSAFTHYALADGPEARRIEAMLPVQRTGKAKAYLFAQGVAGHTIKVQLIHVELFDYDGNPLGAFGLRN